MFVNSDTLRDRLVRLEALAEHGTGHHTRRKINQHGVSIAQRSAECDGIGSEYRTESTMRRHTARSVCECESDHTCLSREVNVVRTGTEVAAVPDHRQSDPAATC